ncbi:hypothetical protein ACFFQF_33205 [Haladaptatus pallidirubidus]|uniref:hypothetical protein n=1 Tax=Haladaptatus pallidirubidus TaxID=1008152 RepID=UPI0035E85FD7
MPPSASLATDQSGHGLRPFRASGFDASTKRTFGCVSRWSTDTKPACVLDACSGRVDARCWSCPFENARSLRAQGDAREGASERAEETDKLCSGEM